MTREPQPRRIIIETTTRVRIEGTIPSSPMSHAQESHIAPTRREKNTNLAIPEALMKEKHIGAVFEGAFAYAVEQYFSDDPEIVAKRKRIEAGISEDAVRNAVILGDFGNLSQADPHYYQLLEAASLANHMAREVVKEIVGQENALELTPAQKVAIMASCDIADQKDILNELWTKEVVTGTMAKEFAEMEEQEKGSAYKLVEEQMKGAGDFWYGVFRRDIDGNVQFVPYANAYPQPIAAISDTLAHALEELSAIGDEEALGMAAVLRDYQKLITSTAMPSEQNTLARNLDKTWMEEMPVDRFPMQFIYPIEVAGDIFSKLVQLDWALAVEDTRYKDVNDDAKAMRDAMVTYYGEDADFSKFDVVGQSLPILGRSQAALYTMLIGGTRLGFRPAAQNLVNVGDLRLIYGAKIFEDSYTFQQRYEIAKNHLEGMFGKDYFAQELGDKDAYIRMLAGTFVAGHEVGHNLFVVADSIERLGSDLYTNLEEFKSDLSSIVVAKNFLPREQQAFFVKTLFAEEMRGMTRRAQSNDLGHFYGNLGSIQLMLDSGLLVKTDSGWRFDVTDGKLDDFFARAKQVLLDMAEVYQTRDPQVGEAFRQKYYKETPELLEVEEAAGIITKDQHTQLLQQAA